MARTRRQYGSGCLLTKESGFAIRWRELETAPDGSTRKVLRYESLGHVTRKEATETLGQKMAATGNHVPQRSRVTFGTVAREWQAHVLPIYKSSTQKNHQHIMTKHLLPRFGDAPLSNVTRQEIQVYVSHLMKAGYAPKTIDHIHDVLSAVLRTAVKWGHLHDNPARGVDLPTLRTVRSKWALTTDQAADLLTGLPLLPRTMAGLAILSGLRRGELFALRWQDLDETSRTLTVREAVYEGTFDTPKTAAGLRQIPLAESALALLATWKAARATHVAPDKLVFATRSGKPIAPNNVLRRWVFPACEAQQLPHATWLTFRRTYSTWSHDEGVPGKVIAQLMGHAKVDTTLNVYTQVLDASVRSAADRVGAELFTIVHSMAEAAAVSH